MPRPARHLHRQVPPLVPQNALRRSRHRVDAVRMERRSRAVEVLRYANAAGERGRGARVQPIDVLACGYEREVPLDEGKHVCDCSVAWGADIEREGNFSRHRIRAPRFEIQYPGRSQRLVRSRKPVTMQNHLTRCKQSISPTLQIRSPRVGVASLDGDAQPLVGLHPGDDADFLVRHFEEGPLLDVELEVGGHGGGFVGGGRGS